MGVDLSVSEEVRPLCSALESPFLAAARELLRLAGQEASELSLALVGDAEMAQLNERFRGRAGPTDVLSFSLLEGDHAERRGGLLGDVVIDVPVAARQAEERDETLEQELVRLLVHGLLHLLGHDHQEDAEAARMQAEERRLLAALSTSDTRSGPAPA